MSDREDTDGLTARFAHVVTAPKSTREWLGLIHPDDRESVPGKGTTVFFTL